MLPIPAAEKVGIAFDTESGPCRMLARANALYYFMREKEDGQLDLVEVTLPTVAGTEAATTSAEPSRLDSVGKIPVMILVDEDEPATRRIWEPRLRQRLAEASDIFERHCRIRFEVVAVGTWESDNSMVDFEKSLREFELEVIPAPAMLAIGFTSQYKVPSGRTHLGGGAGRWVPTS